LVTCRPAKARAGVEISFGTAKDQMGRGARRSGHDYFSELMHRTGEFNSMLAYPSLPHPVLSPYLVLQDRTLALEGLDFGVW